MSYDITDLGFKSIVIIQKVKFNDRIVGMNNIYAAVLWRKCFQNKMEIDTGPVCVNTYPKLKNLNWDQEKKLWLRDSYYFLLSSLTFQRQKLRGTSNRGSG